MVEASNTEEMPDLLPVLGDFRRWALRNTPEDKKDDRYTMLVAVLRPDGRVITAMPGWQGSDEGDEDEFRKQMHGWVDAALAKRRQVELDSFDGLDVE